MPALVIVFSVAVIGVLYVVEQFVSGSYVIKTLIKASLLLVLPLLLLFVSMRGRPLKLLGLSGMRLKSLLPGFLVGIFSFVVILGAYFLLGRFIDLPGIVSDLMTRPGVTPENFLPIGLYVIVVNSLIEEFFFRGFLFLNLKDRLPLWSAYVFSAGAFSVYHVAIITGWFNPVLMILALLSLFVIGLVFNFLNSRSGNILNSWLAHMIADSALVLIGFRLFGLI